MYRLGIRYELDELFSNNKISWSFVPYLSLFCCSLWDRSDGSCCRMSHTSEYWLDCWRVHLRVGAYVVRDDFLIDTLHLVPTSVVRRYSIHSLYKQIYMCTSISVRIFLNVLALWIMALFIFPLDIFVNVYEIKVWKHHVDKDHRSLVSLFIIFNVL